MDPSWIGLVALGKRIIVPESVLTISFSVAHQEYHEWQRCQEHKITDRPNVSSLYQQVMPLLQTVDC